MLTVIKRIETAVKTQLQSDKKLDYQQYCQWFYCNMNPICGRATSESNYNYTKYKVGCGYQKGLNCGCCHKFFYE